MATIIIPTPLRKFTENSTTFDTSGGTVAEALQELVTKFPSIRQQLYDDQNQIRPFINLYIGDEDIRSLEKENTPLASGATLSIVPAIAGGTSLEA